MRLTDKMHKCNVPLWKNVIPTDNKSRPWQWKGVFSRTTWGMEEILQYCTTSQEVLESPGAKEGLENEIPCLQYQPWGKVDCQGCCRKVAPQAMSMAWRVQHDACRDILCGNVVYQTTCVKMATSESWLGKASIPPVNSRCCKANSYCIAPGA